MTERPFLSERMMTVTIPRLNARALETDLGVDGRSIAFDRNGAVIGPVEVVIVWATRQPSEGGSTTTDVIGIDGDLHGRVGELTVRAGDLFTIDGQTAKVTIPAKDIDGVAVAGFRLTVGG